MLFVPRFISVFALCILHWLAFRLLCFARVHSSSARVLMAPSSDCTGSHISDSRQTFSASVLAAIAVEAHLCRCSLFSAVPRSSFVGEGLIGSSVMEARSDQLHF